MRNISLAVTAAALIAGVILPATAPGQEPGVAPLVLTLPGGTRAQAMGRAGVAVADPDAIFHNPAQLATPRGAYLSAQRYGGAATLATISASMAFLGGGVGIGVQWLDYQQPFGVFAPGAGEAALPLPGDFPASELVASLGYARTYRGFRVGVAAKAAEMRHAQRGGTFAADIGIARTFFNVVTVGLAAQNLGPALELAGEEHDLPRRYTIGAATQGYPIGAWLDLAMAAAIPVYEDGTVLPGGGVELSYVPLAGVVFSGRIGARAVKSGDESPFTAGAAFGFDGLSVEYAYQAFDSPGSGHRIGLRITPQ